MTAKFLSVDIAPKIQLTCFVFTIVDIMIMHLQTIAMTIVHMSFYYLFVFSQVRRH